MEVPHPLPDPLAELVASRFRVLAEPVRIKLLERLQQGPATVGELAAALGASQQNISKHLGVLHQAGILRREKDGNYVRYQICDASVFELCDVVCTRLQRQISEMNQLTATLSARAPSAS